jgi:hypothetical protein
MQILSGCLTDVSMFQWLRHRSIMLPLASPSDISWKGLSVPGTWVPWRLWFDQMRGGSGTWQTFADYLRLANRQIWAANRMEVVGI